MLDIPNWVIQSLLEKSVTPWGFERFCARHFSSVENIRYVVTSPNYDEGRDARTEYPRLVGGSAYILASLQRSDLAGKAARDLAKLLASDRQPKRVRFCFTAPITEVLRDRIIKDAIKAYPGARYEVTGLEQLLDSIGRFTDVFESEFENEIAEFRRFAQRTKGSPTGRALGLRVALGTQVSGTAHDLRLRILRSLVLRALPELGQVSREELASAVGIALALDQPVHTSYLLECLTSLESEDLISQTGELVERRRKAIDFLEKLDVEAAAEAVNGYSVVKDVIERQVGGMLDKNIMRRIWPVIKTGLVRLFHIHGLNLASSIHRLSEGDVDAVGAGTSEVLIEGMALLGREINHLRESDGDVFTRVGAVVSTGALLNDPRSYSWLSQLSLIYVTACSLALHPNSLAHVEQRIKSWQIIPDTHVILSLFGCAESDHEATGRLTRSWVQLGGVMLAVAPVVTETSRHAQRAHAIFERWSTHYRRLTRVAARRGENPALPDTNVFLRAAQRALGDKANPSTVASFLSQFYSVGDHEGMQILRLLSEEFGFRLAAGEDVRGPLRDALLRDLIEIRRDAHQSDEHAIQDRCVTDAETLAYLSALRRSPEFQGKFVAILSTSSHMRKVCSNYPAAFGAASAIVNTARIAFAMSLNPGTAMGAKSLKSMLFGRDFSGLVAANQHQAREVLNEFASQDLKSTYTSSLEQRIDGSVFNERG